MKKLLLFLFLFLLDRMAYADVLVVSVNGENQAALLDAATYKVLARLPTGVNPHDIAVSADGRLAYIAVMGTPQQPGHSMTVLDLERRAVKTTLELNPYRQCHDLRASRNGARLWATCAPSKAVIEIDTRSGRIVRNWKLDQEGAWMLVVTPDARKIYTANLEGKSVSIIDRRAGTVRVLPFDSSQIGIDVAPNGREVWVHHTEKRAVSIIDVATDKVVATLPSGGRGFGRVKFTPDGKYVLIPQSESKNLALFDAAERKLLADIPLSAAPKVITVAPDSRRAIITSPDADLAMVVDLTTRKEISTFPTGKTPDGIAWAATPPNRTRINGSGFVAFNNGQLHYELAGQGCAVVLIGGGGGMDVRQWDEQYKFLRRKYKTIRFDPRGTGRSDSPAAAYSNVADLKAVLDHLGIAQATLIGLSLGGGIALDFTLTHPERVTSLVLSGPLVPGFQISDELRKRVNKFAQAGQLGVTQGVKVFLDDPYFVPAPGNPRARATAERLMIENARSITPGLTQPFDPPTVTRVAEIKQPVLLLIGELDHPDLHRRIDFLAQTIGGAKKADIKQAGHLINLEQPQEFIRATDAFLQTLNCGASQRRGKQ